jgi:DNA-binding winged helix-turn-helix (wHTH) protein
MKRWLTLRTILVLGAILFVVGVSIAWVETERFCESEYATFTNQSLQMASVFARSARVWLLRGNEEALGFAASLLLAGSGQYVRIVADDNVVLDKRNDDPAIEALNLERDSADLASNEPSATLAARRLDVVVPIEISNQRSGGLGIVQIGFSDTYARAQVKSHRLLVFGLAGGSWLLLMLAAILVARIVSMRARLAAARLLDADTEVIIRCGLLEIDTDSCVVQLCEQEIELTPKMFELLTFLARNEGKTFSDADLLAALWTDAPYAASGDIKQCIYMLRRRLSVASVDPKRIIVNVKGFGYKLEPPTEEILRSN